ncbi:MAG: HlyD family secretion protein [Hyphomicrobiales bacterium]
MRKFSITVISICLILFFWYLVADRLTPYTANARVKAYVVPIVPQVSGYVVEVKAKNNELMKPGDVLFQIDKKPYQLAIDDAKAALDLAAQDVGASSASVETAQARLAKAQTELSNVEVQAARIFQLEKQKLVPIAQADDARAKLAATKAQVDEAQAELEKAKEQLGSDDEKNPRIRAAVADLGNAELNFQRSTIYAPSLGVVTDLKVDMGSYAKKGTALMTYISVTDVWIEAYFTENNLGNIKEGDEVSLVFDVQPGRRYKGKIASLTVGASIGRESRAGDLPSVETKRGWLRDPQRFPVIIALTDYDPETTGEKIGLRVNGQVDAMVFTGDNGFMNSLGRAWMWFVSWLSFAY